MRTTPPGKRPFTLPPLWKNRYLMTAAIFLVWILLFDRINVIDWIAERMHLNTLEKEKEQLERHIRETRQRIDAFANPDSLETIAREQFYFAEPDEEIFIIEDDE
ncbi:MAG: septum formation initiator family protein [Prevotellaceae bacterium]|jgi:cell division protein FtsB|nr:septum formation initiator family protein [Prevotellaceae bacterium]